MNEVTTGDFGVGSWVARRARITPDRPALIAGAGEIVGAAFVVLSPGAAATEAELLASCRGRLTANQVPTSITVVDALPRNAVGKLVREDVLRLMSEEPNRSEAPEARSLDTRTPGREPSHGSAG